VIKVQSLVVFALDLMFTYEGEHNSSLLKDDRKGFFPKLMNVQNAILRLVV
jgi:hypothetical protein